MAFDIDRLASAHGRRVFSGACRVLGDAELADVQQGSCLRLLERPTHNDVEHWAAYHRLKASAIATQATRHKGTDHARQQTKAETEYDRQQ